MSESLCSPPVALRAELLGASWWETLTVSRFLQRTEHFCAHSLLFKLQIFPAN